MVYSHTISLKGNKTIGGAPYGWEEVVPGSEEDPLQWDVFIQSIRDIGFDGLLSAEQCSPIIMKGHKLGGIKTVDERYIESIEYLKGLLLKHKCYTGHKEMAIVEAARKSVFAKV
jgi:sugar phosphate isomerase/epimerase